MTFVMRGRDARPAGGRRRAGAPLVAATALFAVSCVGQLPGTGPEPPRHPAYPATPPGVPILPPPARVLRSATPPPFTEAPAAAAQPPAITPAPTPTPTPQPSGRPAVKIPTIPPPAIATPVILATPTPLPTVALSMPTNPPPTPTPEVLAGTNRDVAKFTFTVSLDSLADIKALRRKHAFTEALEMARRHPEAQIYVAAYVTEGDIRASHADAGSVSDELVIQTARYLVDHGIDPNRIVGKGEGVNPMIGRAVVISFDLSAEPATKPRKPHEFA